MIMDNYCKERVTIYVKPLMGKIVPKHTIKDLNELSDL